MNQERSQSIPNPFAGDEFPLHRTVAAVNEKLGLYLSDTQQKGLAVGILVGVSIGAALVSWSLGNAVRREF